MTSSRNPDPFIQSFLREGDVQLGEHVYDAVRAEIEQTRQRVVIGPWRLPPMNKIVGYGLAAGALIVAVIIGVQFLGMPVPANVGEPPPSHPSPTLEPTPTPSRTPSDAGGVDKLPYVVTGADAAVHVTVEPKHTGWHPLRQFEAITKGDDGLDPPDSVGVALLAWTWPAGTEFDVYGNPCQWSTTIPETPARTPEEIASALAEQEMVEATTPVDVTVGGYAGKAVTVHVPLSFDMPNASREERFGDCDEDVFGYYGTTTDTEPARNAQGAGQIDELWILDVEGSIVILDAMYGPAAPAELVEELRALAESATFEAP